MSAGRDGQPPVDGFLVTPAALSGAAGVFDAEADRIDDLVATLTRELDRLGPCWGRDDVASRFGVAYQDAGFAVLDDIGALAVGAGRIAGALRAVADSYDEADGELLAALASDADVPDES